MTKEQVIIISPEGDLTFLTHGDDALLQEGDARIVRASHIRFSNTEKKWFVYFRHPGGEERLYPGHVKRSDAIQAEIVACQPLLYTSPHFVEEMLKGGGFLDSVGDDSSG